MGSLSEAEQLLSPHHHLPGVFFGNELALAQGKDHPVPIRLEGEARDGVRVIEHQFDDQGRVITAQLNGAPYLNREWNEEGGFVDTFSIITATYV